MAEWAIAPARCIVAEHAIDEVGRVARAFGRDAVVVGGETALSRVAEPLRASLRESGVACRDVHPFSGECAPTAIDRIQASLRSETVAVAVGGGKAIDATKAAARSVGCPLITIPTSAATCAAATGLVVMHTEGGAYDVGRMTFPGPEALILDVSVVRTAPARLLAAGLADAWARTRETELAARVGLPTAMAVCSHGTAAGYGHLLIEAEGAAALPFCQLSSSDAVFERVVTACILAAGVSSGLCGGFYLLNVAHSIAYGLTHVLGDDALFHGEAVGLGLLVQGLLEDPKGRSFAEVRSMLLRWGLPVSFSAIEGRATFDAGNLARRAHAYLDHEHAVPFDVTEAALRAAIERVASAE